MTFKVLHDLRKIFSVIIFIIYALGAFNSSASAEILPCSEAIEFHQLDWKTLPVHNDILSRECHSKLSHALKANADTNEMLSRAVYHQILAGKSFRKIPLWPDKHKDWVGAYDGYDYLAVFLPAIKAARESWEAGFDSGGYKHDFAIGWTLAVLKKDFEINETRNRTGRFTNLKNHLVLPGLILIFLVLIEALIDRFGWLPKIRLFYRYKYR